MPGPIPLRNGTGEGLGYHRRARRDVQSRRLPFLVGGNLVARVVFQPTGTSLSTKVVPGVLRCLARTGSPTTSISWRVGAPKYIHVHFPLEPSFPVNTI